MSSPPTENFLATVLVRWYCGQWRIYA